MISKTHISVQKLRGRQLNAKVCGSESAIFLILVQKGAVLAIYTSYTSLYKIIQYNLLFLVLAIYTSYTSLYKIIR